MTKSVSKALQHLEPLLRARLDPLGCVEGEDGAFMTGHAPQEGKLHYLFRRYAGLDEDGLHAAEQECNRNISGPYREFLTHMNGANVLGIVLQGTAGSLLDRSGKGIGQPISLRYQNLYRHEDYIPPSHIGIGAINGDWHAQGHLYLSSKDEVELYHSKYDLIGARWPSLADFLLDELPRRLEMYDETGLAKPGSKLLPGDTETWEQLALEAHEKEEAERARMEAEQMKTRAERSILGRLSKAMRGK